MTFQQATREPSVDPLIGQKLAGRYVIRRLIGAGGVGLVYLAQDEEANRQVVVKVLAPNWADNDEALARFEREAKRLNDLEHPNIVRLFSYGNENGRAYIVMEYADGELLSAYVKRRGRLELRDFVPIASQILKGMGYAHARGLMLRDVKPANIMLTSTGGRANFVKLLDFGLAKLIEGDAEITQQHVVGTAAYLSPEQIKGEELDLRVDVYAVGVLFYFMVTGRLPFEADNTANVFYKHVNEDPPPLGEILEPGHDIPDDLMALIHQCLLKERDERPADANEIVEGLIDAVPDLSLFKLPKVKGAAEQPSDTFSVTDTGVHSLRPTGAPMREGSHPVSADVPRSEAEDEPVAAPEIAAVEPQPKRRTGLIVGILAATAALGIGAFVMMNGQTGEPENVGVSGGAADADTAAGPSVEEGLAKIEASIDEGKFDDAIATADGLATTHAEDAAAVSRIKSLRTRAETGKLMSSAATLEEKGELEAALAIYQSVVEKDAAHTDAQSAIARLTKALAATAGKLGLECSPTASVSINGKPAGETPVELDLQPGDYLVELSADGYLTKKETVTVAKGETLRIKQRLVKSKRRGSPSPAPAKTETAAPAPEPKPKKSDPFLPSRNSKEDDGFMPAKK